MSVCRDLRADPRSEHEEEVTKRYRTKPILVEAIQYTGGPLNERGLEAFAGEDVAFRMDGFTRTVLIGPLEAWRGDWLVRVPDGRLLVVSEATFPDEYEAA